MHAILDYLYFIVRTVLTLMVWVVILYAIASTLISFHVINLRNRIVFAIWRGLEAMALPMLRPIRRFLPMMGPMDFSALAFLVLVGGANTFLVPPLFHWLHDLVGPRIAAY